MGVLEAVKKVNEGGLRFIAGREKGRFEDLLDRPVTVEAMAFLQSKFDEGREVAVFTVAEDPDHFYRTGGGAVVEQLRELQAGLDEDGLGWDALVLVFQDGRTKQNRRYYYVRAEVRPEARAKLEARGSGGAGRETAGAAAPQAAEAPGADAGGAPDLASLEF